MYLRLISCLSLTDQSHYTKPNKPIHRLGAVVLQIAYVIRIIPYNRAKQSLKRSPSQVDIWIDILEDLSSYL
jgi:hypothetical protein